MPKIAVLVEFEAKPGKEDELFGLLVGQAHGTVAEEPGCLRFEVFRALDADGAVTRNKFILDEVYADDAAMAAHQASPRLATFRPVLETLIASRRATRAHLAS